MRAGLEGSLQAALCISQLLVLYCWRFWEDHEMSTSPQSSLSGASLTRHGKLFNAIVDVCLVYGMDEDTRELEIREEGVSIVGIEE